MRKTEWKNKGEEPEIPATGAQSYQVDLESPNNPIPKIDETFQELQED